MSFSNSNKNTSGLMVALTLPEMEEPPSLHPSPRHAHQAGVLSLLSMS